jgi:3'(2'), 5'-bisphosphate nucleotidase
VSEGLAGASDPASLVGGLLQIARAAGKAALVHYGRGAAARAKLDGSPVTDADDAAEAVILAGLARLTPDIPVVSEERIAAGDRPFRASAAPARFWLVGPLDGTKEFVAGNGEFCVNIGLVVDGYPAIGVIHAPVDDITWACDGRGAVFRTVRDGPRLPIATRVAPPGGVVVVSSRSHARGPALDAYLEDFHVAGRRILGSAIKLAIVAGGEADLYPRFGPTSEWDTCAGQAILEQAGGSVVTLSGNRLAYGKPKFANPDFIARGR